MNDDFRLIDGLLIHFTSRTTYTCNQMFEWQLKTSPVVVVQ